MLFNEKSYKNIVLGARTELTLYNRREKEAQVSRSKIADYANKVEAMGVKITKFSKDIGIGYTTLKVWCSNRKASTKVTELRKKKGKTIDEAVIDRVLKKISKKATPKEINELYEREESRSSEDQVLDNAVEQLKRISFNVCNSYVLDHVDQFTLLAISELCSEISDSINSHIGVVNAKTPNVNRKQLQ